MDILLIQMIFANNAQVNVKHAPKLHPSAQVALQIEIYNLIHVYAYQVFMIQQADVKDALINALLVRLLQLNACLVTQFQKEHCNHNNVFVIKVIMILGPSFVQSVHKHAYLVKHQIPSVNHVIAP